MLPDTFWKKEIAEDLRNRRALLLKFALPLVLLSPSCSQMCQSRCGRPALLVR